MEISFKDEPLQVACERVVEHAKAFSGSCDSILDVGGDEPELGRIAELERALHSLRVESDEAWMSMLSSKVESMGEDEVVEAKKASGPSGA